MLFVYTDALSHMTHTQKQTHIQIGVDGCIPDALQAIVIPKNNLAKIALAKDEGKIAKDPLENKKTQTLPL